MKILIDNTSLHSAGNMLVGSKAKIVDVDSLLQLCLQIIFSEKIYLTGLDLDNIKEKSYSIIQRLKLLGTENDLLEFGNYDMGTLINGCKEASIICAEDLRIFGVPPVVDLSAYGPDLPAEFLDNETKFIEIIKKKPKESELSEIRDFHLSRKANGAVDFMIADSPDLRNSFEFLIAKHGEISKNQIYQLTSFIRARLNQAIANSKGLIYSPSITRAERVRLAVNFVLEELSNSVDSVVKRTFEIDNLELPTLQKYLIIKSKGIPEKMVEEALNMREKAKALRSWLMKFVNSENELDSFEMHKIRIRMKSLSEDLTENLSLKSNINRMSSAIDLSPIISNPIEILKGDKLINWLRYNFTKKRLAALTEISLSTQYTNQLIPMKENLIEYVQFRK